MSIRGWNQRNFIYVSGDAYVDHSSFGPAIISRLLGVHDYKVGIIAQPDWKDAKSIIILGQPRLGFLVSAGNMDSMVNHYSVSKKRRKEDVYTPGGIMGKRPDYVTIAYCNLIRLVYKDSPIIIGGIETSLRWLAHCDHWSDKSKCSTLLDSQADLTLHGIGERSIVEIAGALDSGIAAKDITLIEGTVYRTKSLELVYDYHLLPDYTEPLKGKTEYARSFYVQYSNTDPFMGKRPAEPYEGRVYVVQNPPSKLLSQREMDEVYGLPYIRNYHPSYEEAGGVPAIQEIKSSLASNRGCSGACSFCALTFHQGRITQARSHEPLVQEARLLTEELGLKGYIHDVGGPTADFRFPACEKQMTRGACPNKQCLFPEPCKNLRADHSDYIELLRKLRSPPKVKKVFIRSGIRFDYVLADFSRRFLKKLCEHHVSGQLRVAPEHMADPALEMMRKPKNSVYRQFVEEYKEVNGRLGKNQYLVPYLMSSHPGSSIKEAVELMEYLRDLGYMPEQIQDFYPMPSTISTCMYYTGYGCRTMRKVYVPVDPHEKAMQRTLIQHQSPKNYELVVEALKLAGRMDLIGYDKKCLVRPKGGRPYGETGRETRTQEGRPGQRDGENNRGARSGESACSRGDGSRKDSFRPSAERPKTSARPKKTIRNVHKKARK